MVNVFLQVKDLFVNERCLSLHALLETNRAGLALLLCALAMGTFVVEGILTLAILSCTVKGLRVQGLTGFFWRLGGCLCSAKPNARLKLRDLERMQQMSSEPSSSRNAYSDSSRTHGFADSTRQRQNSDERAVTVFPKMESDAISMQPLSVSGQQTLITAGPRMTLTPPMTNATKRRRKRSASLFRSTRVSSESSRGRSSAQQFAAEAMAQMPHGDSDDEMEYADTVSTRSGFPFPKVGSNTSLARRREAAPKPSCDNSPGSIWTLRK